jgi:hypothetical protein
MALAPEMFEPQEFEDENGNIEQHQWPSTLGSDRSQAKIHAFSLLKELPRLHGIVFKNLTWIMQKAAQKALEQNSGSLPPHYTVRGEISNGVL